MAAAQTPLVTLNDGNTMPQLGLGVWQTPPEDTAEVVRAALDAGYAAVDTAAVYGNEDGVGDALKGRDDVFVTTKLWNTDQGYDQALRAFDKSARRLGRESVDLYLIHWPAPQMNRYLDSWKALVELKRNGRARSIGVSNFTVEALQRIIGETGVTPTVNQIELHPSFQQRELRAFHDRHGIKTESWSPLGRGKLVSHRVFAEVGARHGKTPAQVIIRWHLDNGLIVIPKSVTPSRIRENIDVFDFRLDGDDMERIARLDSPGGRMGPDPATAGF